MTRTSTVACFLACVVPTCAFGAEPGGLTIDQLIAQRSVGNVVISGDGRFVAYTVSQTHPKKEGVKSPLSAVWLLRFGAKKGRQYTQGKAGVSHVSFSEDASHLVFVTRRGTDAKSQVWWMPLDGGEATALTQAPEGVIEYAFSPNGKKLAYTTRASQTDAHKTDIKEGRDQQVVDAHYTHHRLVVMDVASKQIQNIGPPNKTIYEFAWSNDSKQLALMLADSPKSDHNYMFRSLWRYSARGGGGRLLAKDMGKMTQPSWSPDGKTIAWRGASVVNEATTGTLWTVASGGGKPVALNEGAEETVYDAQWTGADTLLVTAVRGTHSHLSRRRIAGHIEALVQGGPSFLRVSVDKTARRMAFVGSTSNHPPDVYTGTVGGKIQRATNHNPELNSVAFAKQETIQWTARDGLTIQGVLVHPLNPKKGQAAPLVMLVHGGPEWQSLDGWSTSYLRPAQVLAAGGYAVLLPNYRGSAGRGAQYAMADHKDLGGKELLDNVDAIKHLAAQGLVDPTRVGMVGGSYGGYMSALAATKASKHFAAAVSFAGISNWVSFTGTSDITYENSLVHWNLWCWDEREKCTRGSAIGFLDQSRTPLLILHGEKDRRVPASQAWELYNALKVKGKTTRLVIYPREGHGLSEHAHLKDCAERIVGWFHKYLKKAKNKP